MKIYKLIVASLLPLSLATSAPEDNEWHKQEFIPANKDDGEQEMRFLRRPNLWDVNDFRSDCIIVPVEEKGIERPDLRVKTWKQHPIHAECPNTHPAILNYVVGIKSRQKMGTLPCRNDHVQVCEVLDQKVDCILHVGWKKRKRCTDSKVRARLHLTCCT